jgi:endonuclease/exonuclease/phosphatase family metal-dependent hydrolase
VVSVHLAVASTLYRTLTRVNAARLRQSLGLLEALALVETRGAPVRPCGQLPHPVATVAAGDFNTWSAGESAVDQMRVCFPDSPPWDGKPTHRSFPTDFIFFRTGGDLGIRYLEGSERRVEDRYNSDHHARIAWFGWRE